MAFSSVPVYNWNQHANQQPTGLIITSDSTQTHPPPPPAPAPPTAASGPGSIRQGSIVDRARLSRIPLPVAGLKCPRCDSTKTKFCYFNNYSLSQPRHFCKTCRRYWTSGGALRNVPVGGGCRRKKRTKRVDRSRSKSPVRRGASTSITGSNVNTSANGIMSSQVLLPPQPQLPFLTGLQQLSGFVSDFGFVPSQLGTSSSVQQFPDLTTGLYPFQDSEFDHGSGLRVKMEGNHGLNLSKNLLGDQGNGDDQFNMWGAGNTWTDPSGFHSSSSAGNLL